ncbi:MAG: pilus assembly protein [Anaerolineae bacterium]|nr:pilus assembly protein [Phycisphaerae bacterium]
MHNHSGICYGWLRRRNDRRSRGAEVLEMALMMPILIGLIFGMVEFGYFFYLKHNLQAAAREGARWGSTLNSNDTEAVAKASAFLTASNLPAGSFSINSTTSGDTITVTVQATWGNVGILHLPLIPLPDSKVVKGVAVMRKEGL